MICIFSSRKDYSTTEVIKWLNYFNENEIIRVNYDEQETLVEVKITENEVTFEIGIKRFNISDITSVWYRKGEHWLCNKVNPIVFLNNQKFSDHITKLMNNERLKFSEFIHYTIENTKPCLGLSTKNDLNKFIVLDIAKRIGLMTPKYLITNKNTNAIDFLNRNQSVISKPLSDVIYLFENEINNQGYFSYTEIVNEESLNKNKSKNVPSLLQEYIEKQFEVRTFYLDGEIYSMAILSQSNIDTKVDFRKYAKVKQNRNIPFKLPLEIDTKVKILFNELKLNTGSVDFIVDIHNNYYFLEVNPVGQFGMVSRPCNYYLEKLVALKLLEYGNK